jgi:hypothetical protein
MIFTIKKLALIQEHLIPGSLITLDLDDTLIQSKTYYGSEEWQWNLYEQYQEDGLAPEEAFYKANLEWQKAQYQIEVCAVENDTLSLIQNWKMKYHIMGLTARNPSLIDITYKQLASLNIDLNSPIHPSGIIFGGGNEKGKALFEYLDKNQFIYKRIVGVDDKKYHLQNILLHCNQKKIGFHGFHYLGKKPYYSSSKS